MYSKIYLRLEPLGLELVAAAARRAGHAVDADRPAGRDPRRLLPPARPLAPDVVAFSGNYLANVPEIVDLAKATRARLPRALRVRRRPQRLVHRRRAPRHADGRARLRAPRRGRAPRSRRSSRRWSTTGASLDQVPGVVTLEAQGPAPVFVQPPRRPAAGARPAAPSPQVLHRPARSVRLDRVQPRLPVGLHLLQRVDLLRPQLPREDARVRRRGDRAESASPASSSWTTSPSSRPSTAWPSARPSRGAASRSATTSRRAATCCCATRRSSSSGPGSA